jgi:Fe2+ transport system protein FeoA
MQPLLDLKAGTRATLVRVDGERSFRRRLMEMGFLPGTAVRVVRRVQIGRLIELELRGCHLSLRLSEAEHLFVAPTDPPGDTQTPAAAPGRGAR